MAELCCLHRLHYYGHLRLSASRRFDFRLSALYRSIPSPTLLVLHMPSVAGSPTCRLLLKRYPCDTVITAVCRSKERRRLSPVVLARSQRMPPPFTPLGSEVRVSICFPHFIGLPVSNGRSPTQIHPALSVIPAGSPLRCLQLFVYLRPASSPSHSD